MENKNSNILIVCWDFPPNHGIGGRRWSKFAKSMIKENHGVFVINKSINQNIGTLQWLDPEIFSKITVYSCREHNLVKWLHDYTSPIKAIKIRLAKWLLGLFYRGTVYDKTIGIEKRFLRILEQVIVKHKIDTVCVTGAPFNLMYYTAKVKERFPLLKILCDYRDPWIKAQNYGMQNLSEKRRQEECNKQNFVFKEVDYVTAPNSFLLEEVMETHTGKQKINARFFELPHAFDPDDVIKTQVKKQTAGVRFVYGGSLYLGVEPYLVFLNESITHLKEKTQNKDLLPKLVFYTADKKHKSIFIENADVVKFYPPVGEKIFQEVAASDFVMILLSSHNKNYVTSKFYEFLPYEKPYVYLGPKGHVSDKIQREGLGLCLFEKEDLLTVVEKGVRQYQRKLDLGQYTFDQRTKHLLKEIAP